MRRALTASILAAALITSSGCARIYLESRGGAETVTLPTADVAQHLDVQYVRKPEEGPLTYRKNAWWLFWGALPLNHPSVARWREDALQPDWQVANETYVLARPWYAWPVMLGTVGIVSLTCVEYRFDPVIVESETPAK